MHLTTTLTFSRSLGAEWLLLFFLMPALVGTDSNTLFETHIPEDNFSLAVLRFCTKIEAFVDANIWSDETRWEVSCRPGARGDDLGNLGGFGMRESEQVGVDAGHFSTWDGVQVQVLPPQHWHYHLNDFTQKFTVISFGTRSSSSASKHRKELLLGMSRVARGKPEESLDIVSLEILLLSPDAPLTQGTVRHAASSKAVALYRTAKYATQLSGQGKQHYSYIWWSEARKL